MLITGHYLIEETNLLEPIL